MAILIYSMVSFHQGCYITSRHSLGPYSVKKCVVWCICFVKLCFDNDTLQSST